MNNNKPVTIESLSDKQLCELIDNRWTSFSTLADVIQSIKDKNTKIYEGNPEWIDKLPRKKQKIRTNRVFVDMEAVINTLIANPPKPNILPNYDSEEVKDVALAQEQYFNTRYNELDTKKEIRKALRNLYFTRLMVLKPFWNTQINDFDVKTVDSTKIRMSPKATKEEDSEFFIEEVEEDVLTMLKKFPNKKEFILKEAGLNSEAEAMIKNPNLTYQECWIQDYVCFKLKYTILDRMPNPYWDWQGLVVTDDEIKQLVGGDIDPNTGQPMAPISGDNRRMFLYQIKQDQEQRKTSMAMAPTEGEAEKQSELGYEKEAGDVAQTEEMAENAGENLMAESPYSNFPVTQKQYFYNYFDKPRKPYIIATVFDNENQPIGRTDMIFLASSLQESIDVRKIDISDNCQLVNGWLKVDKSVMSKAEAEKIRFEAQGVVWGKGVINGVTREMGTPLPAMVFEDMQDSRNEIDNIMAATSAFRGEREGTETKGGRLALVDQSYLRLNELVQVVDYVSRELFAWWYHLAKIRYTEYHFAKTTGPNMALKIMNVIQDDFIDGSQMRIIPGKTLPEDKVFKMEQAQKDMEAGIIAPEDYMEVAGYEDPKTKIRNAVMFKTNPLAAVGITHEEMGMPPVPPVPMNPAEVPVDNPQ